MAGGRPRKPTDRDREAEELVQRAAEQLAAESKSARKHAGMTTVEVSSPHLLLAVSAARLAAAADRLARHHVALAREVEGATWEQVGEAFGTSRQSAHERFRSGSADVHSSRRRTPTGRSARK